MAKFFLFFGLFCFSFVVSGQTFSFDSILNKKPILKTVNANVDVFRLQIIYTQITRDSNGKPTFKNYTYKLDSTNYFYCASLVKLPCSILALEKVNVLKIDKDAYMFTDSSNACQHSVKRDVTSLSGYPSVAQYIKRMFLISDNFSFGRIYEFLGVDYLHNRLASLGYENMRIVHRFDGGCKETEHTTTNPISFFDTNFKLIYLQKPQISLKQYNHPLGIVKVGKAHMNAQNKKINEPKDFTQMNYISLQNIHSMLQRLVFNDFYPAENQYCITKDDQQFLLNYLTLYPRESTNPTYASSQYYDSYKKYFI